MFKSEVRKAVKILFSHKLMWKLTQTHVMLKQICFVTASMLLVHVVQKYKGLGGAHAIGK